MFKDKTLLTAIVYIILILEKKNIVIEGFIMMWYMFLSYTVAFIYHQ